MVALTVRESYATIAEADLLLPNNTLWAAASDEDKEEALLSARYFIDTNFSCPDLTDYIEVPQQLQYANTVLAANYLADTTIFDSGANIKRQLVDAEVVVETEYFGGNTPKPTKLQEVKGILKGLCSFSKSTVFLTRG